jgi:hypothetical protein
MLIFSNIKFSNNNEILLKKIIFDGPLVSISGDIKISNRDIENAYFPIFKLYSSEGNISSDLSFKYLKDKTNKLIISIVGKKLRLGKEGVLPFFNFERSNNTPRDTSIDISFDSLVSRSGLNYTNVKFLLEKSLSLINNFHININLKNEKIIHNTFSNQNTKKINFYSKNIENIIDLLGLDIDIVGGPFNLQGVINETDDEIFTGNLSLGKFSILKLPIFAKLLNISLPSLTSLLDDNSGINFKSALAVININDTGINIIDGVIKADSDVPIFGSSLGMTLSGVYSFAKKTDISGTLVPLEGFNTAPSKLPLVGGLFKGGKKGQGLIGINFRIYEDKDGKLDIQSNPLSILTPGFLQRIF